VGVFDPGKGFVAADIVNDPEFPGITDHVLPRRHRVHTVKPGLILLGKTLRQHGDIGPLFEGKEDLVSLSQREERFEATDQICFALPGKYRSPTGCLGTREEGCAEFRFGSHDRWTVMLDSRIAG